MENFSQWLGLLNSSLWIVLLVAEIIALAYPSSLHKRPLLYRELVLAGLVGVLVWRCGLLVSSRGAPVINRQDLALVLRSIDFVTVSIFCVRFGLILRRCVRIERPQNQSKSFNA